MSSLDGIVEICSREIRSGTVKQALSPDAAYKHNVQPLTVPRLSQWGINCASLACYGLAKASQIELWFARAGKPFKEVFSTP
jgi:hypothetical protein